MLEKIKNSFNRKTKPSRNEKKSSSAKVIEDKKGKGILTMEINIGKVNLTQKAFFAKNLSVMLKSGLTISDALDISIDSATGKLKNALRGIARSVDAGRPLSEALKPYPRIFPPFFISAVYAGEESGTLEENLEQVAIQLSKEKELASKIKSAMIYPAIILIASFVLGMFVSFSILPKITPLFEGMSTELPASTRFLIFISNFMQEHGIKVFWGIIIFAIFMTWLVRQKFSKPYFHFLYIHFPIVKGISRGANLARFSRILGTLLKSGLNIDEALKISQNSVGNYYYRTSLNKVMERINKGASMSESLIKYEKLYPRILSRMIKVGEESGKLDETLLYLADFYEEEVDNATKALAIAIEPILLIGIGAAVGFLALSIITPIYNITGSIGGH